MKTDNPEQAMPLPATLDRPTYAEAIRWAVLNADADSVSRDALLSIPRGVRT